MQLLYYFYTDDARVNKLEVYKSLWNFYTGLSRITCCSVVVKRLSNIYFLPRMINTLVRKYDTLTDGAIVQNLTQSITIIYAQLLQLFPTINFGLALLLLKLTHNSVHILSTCTDTADLIKKCSDDKDVVELKKHGDKIRCFLQLLHIHCGMNLTP